MHPTNAQSAKLLKSNLTDSQLDALVILSSRPYGLTNRELTICLEKSEREEGNVLNKIVKPLESCGIIYKMDWIYPNNLLIINKNAHILGHIETHLKSKIECYINFDKKKVEECRKKGLWLKQKGLCFFWRKPVTAPHLKIRNRLVNYVYLYRWINRTLGDLIMLPERDGGKVTQIPRCEFCRDILNDETRKLCFREISGLSDEIEREVVDFPFRVKPQPFKPSNREFNQQ